MLLALRTLLEVMELFKQTESDPTVTPRAVPLASSLARFTCLTLFPLLTLRWRWLEAATEKPPSVTWLGLLFFFLGGRLGPGASESEVSSGAKVAPWKPWRRGKGYSAASSDITNGNGINQPPIISWL
jgi:hypothetical protein